MNSVFVNHGIVASLVIVVIISGNLFLSLFLLCFFSYIRMRYNILLLHTILIQCYM